MSSSPALRRPTALSNTGKWRTMNRYSGYSSIFGRWLRDRTSSRSRAWKPNCSSSQAHSSGEGRSMLTHRSPSAVIVSTLGLRSCRLRRGRSEPTGAGGPAQPRLREVRHRRSSHSVALPSRLHRRVRHDAGRPATARQPCRRGRCCIFRGHNRHIQRGGGTGPLKPRQPPRRGRCQLQQVKFLGDVSGARQDLCS